MTRLSDIRSCRSARANAQGHSLENYISAACEYYKRTGAAVVEKMPEPFRVTSSGRDGTFQGRFTANAQPDFMGTLDGGQAIVFEAKHTSTTKLQQSVITGTQWDALEAHWQAGAKAGVCVSIGDTFAFIPWGTWKEMKRIYGRKYLTEEDIEMYRIRFDGRALFLDYVHAGAAEDD